MFCFKNIPTLIFAGDVDTSSNVDNAGFLPVFPPTNSNDTGKYSSGKFSLFLGFTTAKLLHICTKFHQRATLKLYCEWFFCPGTQPQSLSLWGRLQRPTLSFSPFTSNLVTGVKFFSLGQQNLIKKPLQIEANTPLIKKNALKISLNIYVAVICHNDEMSSSLT